MRQRIPQGAERLAAARRDIQPIDPRLVFGEHTALI